MSTAIEFPRIEYRYFCQERDYKQFRLDLDECASPQQIAAQALCSLCNGNSGPMNLAVIQAVLLLLNDCTTLLGSLEDCFKDLVKEMPFEDQETCNAWINQWCK